MPVVEELQSPPDMKPPVVGPSFSTPGTKLLVTNHTSHGPDSISYMNVAEVLGPLAHPIWKVDNLIVQGRIDPVPQPVSPDITTAPTQTAPTTVYSLLLKLLELLSFRPEFPFGDLVESVGDLKAKTGIQGRLDRGMLKLEKSLSKRLTKLVGGLPDDATLDTSPIPAPLQLPPDTILPPIPPDLPNDNLQLAIYWHDRDQLLFSAYYFSLSACSLHPLGLFLFGMCLRHGWGLPQADEKKAYLYFVKSLQVSLRDIESFTVGLDRMRDRSSDKMADPNALAVQVASVEEIAQFLRNKPLPPLPGQITLTLPNTELSPILLTFGGSRSPTASPSASSPSASSTPHYDTHIVFSKISDTLFEIIAAARQVQEHVNNREWERNRATVELLVRNVQVLALITREHIDPLVAGVQEDDPIGDVDVEAILGITTDGALVLPNTTSTPTLVKAIWSFALTDVGRAGKDLVIQSFVLSAPIVGEVSGSTSTLRKVNVQMFLRGIARLVYSVRRLVLATQKVVETFPPPIILSLDHSKNVFSFGLKAMQTQAKAVIGTHGRKPSKRRRHSPHRHEAFHLARTTRDGNRPFVEHFRVMQGPNVSPMIGPRSPSMLPPTDSVASMPSAPTATPNTTTPASRPLTLQRPDRPPPILTPQGSFTSTTAVSAPAPANQSANQSRPGTLQRPRPSLAAQASFPSSTQVAPPGLPRSGTGGGRRSMASLVLGTIQRVGGTLQRNGTTGNRSSPMVRGLGIAAAFSTGSFGSDVNEERERAGLMANLVLPLILFQMGVSTQQGWGVPCCLPLSCFFFSISSRLGDADAQEQLGYAYKNGAGVRRDKWKAALWLRESAMAGAEAVGDGKPVNVALARSRVLGDSWIWKQKWGGPDL